ncbi:MAG: DUF456 domain-containing protein [Bacteroidales bacterium]|nr:DUF456 domain-containing protein [Bacteroidales bacterium]OQA92249.1 MAG: hypothetical protein BWY27_00371 [Bacteroidetes bacterium ADurb.Bin234]
MDIFLIVIGIVLLIVGLIGSVAPVLPGPPIAYVSLLLLQFTSKQPFSLLFLILLAAVVIIVTILDYIIPTIRTKKFGGSSYGAWGCIIGTLAGLFMFPPIGIIIMPFVGAFIGEMIYDNNFQKALRAAFGSFLGFLSGTLMKLVVCVVMIVAFVWGLF